jgi:hypothetical protein
MLSARPPVLLALTLWACHPGGSGDGISQLEAHLSSEVNTVVELSWVSEEEGASWVEFGLDEQRRDSTAVEAESSTDHVASLYGLPAFSTVYYEVFTEAEGGLQSEQGQVMTGGLPAGLPDLTTQLLEADAVSPERFMLAVVLGIEGYLVVVDRAGEVVWYQRLDDDWHEYLVMCLDFSNEGRGLVYGAFSRDPHHNPSFAAFTGWDGVDRELRDLGNAHHDLAEHHDGAIATIRPKFRTWTDPASGDEVEVSGDSLVRIAPDGTTRELFNAFDWAEISVNDNFYHEGMETGDWTHANALRFYPDNESYLLSLGNLDTVLEISASTGEVLREFGPGGYAVVDGAPFVFQHDPHWTEDGTLLMSSSVGESDRLMAIEYAVDDETGTLEEIWSYGKDEDYSSVASGQAIRMANGNTLLNTGYNGLLVEVNPQGEPVWELAASVGGIFLSATFFDDFYAR